ncbi:DUF502 domain-containing protein [bacterium]|nr:DUF502 domain-containing protein [bacterium]
MLDTRLQELTRGSGGKLKQLRNMFLTGLLVIGPLSITIWIVVYLFKLADGVLGRPIQLFLGRVLQIEYFIENRIYGVGLVALILIILLTGWLARLYLGVKAVKVINNMIGRIPLVNKVYIAIVQISEALLGGQKDVFKTPVLIEFPKPGTYSVGFITQDTRGPIQNALHKDVISVFVPTTPNPTSGYLLFVAKDEAVGLNVSVEEALKLIISGGAVVPNVNRNAHEVAKELGLQAVPPQDDHQTSDEP